MRLPRARRPALWSALVVGAVAASSLAAVAVSRAPSAHAATTGAAPVAFVATNTAGISSFSTANLGSSSGAINSGGAANPAVALTPDDSTVVALGSVNGADVMTITSLTAPTFDVGAGKVPTAQATLAGQGTGLAISPNGATAYTVVLIGASYDVQAVDLATATASAPIPLPTTGNANLTLVTSLALSPDGDTLYVGGATSGTVGDQPAIDTLAVGGGTAAAPWSPSATNETVGALAISPNGQTLFAGVGDDVVPFGLPALNPGTEIATDSTSVTSLAISPDGHEVYFGASGSNTPLGYFAVGSNGPATAITAPGLDASDSITGLAVSAASNQLIGTCRLVQPAEPCLISVPLEPSVPTGASSDIPTANVASVYPQSHTSGDFDALAITPDQGPVAVLSASTQNPTLGQPVAISASASTVRFGSIPADDHHYIWAWSGGGCTPSYSTETLNCTFNVAGTYTVSLTEVDGAGTSTTAFSAAPPNPIDFTGQTAGRVANTLATTTIKITAVVSSSTTTAVSTTVHSTTTTPTATNKPGPAVAPVATQPTLTANPGLGPPGFVTQVSGTGFPANTPLTVTWSVGEGSAQVTTSASGTFTVPMLVMPEDLPGNRNAQVATFPTAVAPFLVVPGSLQPGGDNGSIVFSN